MKPTRRWRHLPKTVVSDLVMMTAFIRRIGQNYIFKRGKRIKKVQRFLASWLAILGLVLVAQLVSFDKLSPYFLVDKPALGGVFIEGVTGEFSALNPLYADTLAGRTANRLIFSGLAKDNYEGRPEPDLAESWQIGHGGEVYTVHLRPNIFWHDGRPVTANDVLFTVRLIQDPAARSSLADSWRGVKVRSLDERTVEFRLPAPFAPFPSLLTVGLLPQHILGDLPPERVRFSDYNSHPIGSGPYKFDRLIEGAELRLVAFEKYHQGRPNIASFLIKTYKDYGALAEAYSKRQVTGTGGFSLAESRQFPGDHSSWDTSTQTFLFLNNRNPLLGDKSVRQAIAMAIDTHAIANEHPGVKTARAPLLPQHLGYDRKLEQHSYDVDTARELLDKAGWKELSEGVRTRGRQTLVMNMVVPQTDIYPIVASQIQEQLRKVGIQTQIQAQESEELQRDAIGNHHYDLFLYSISLGADPDVYTYWHSSQAKPGGLNLSNYRSRRVDEALEAGRTRLDDEVRRAKYAAFLEAWRDDAPAVALYRQPYFYAYRGIEGLEPEWLPEPLDRLTKVHVWAVKTVPKLKRLE